jgi:hypothetical protein
MMMCERDVVSTRVVLGKLAANSYLLVQLLSVHA